MNPKQPQDSTCRSIQSSSSVRPESIRSFSFTSQPTSHPKSPKPTLSSRHSMVSPSSMAASSIYSQRFGETHEKAPLLPNFNEKGEEIIESHGERIWEPQSQASGGQRTEHKHQRGCLMPRASLNDQARWKMNVQEIIGFDFSNVDLLEEALESKSSGVTSVGESHRHCLDGNRGLARVGEAIMKLVLLDQCYLFCVHEKDASTQIENIVSWPNLAQLGIATKLQQYIRPRAPIRPSQSRNILAQAKDEVKRLGEDPRRTIAFGIRAVIGAVYFDKNGGLDGAKRVMARLELIIKLPM